MVGVAEVQGGDANALGTLLTNFKHPRFHGAWITSTEYTKIGGGRLKSFSGHLRQHFLFQTKRPPGSGTSSGKFLGITAEKEIFGEEFTRNRYTEDGLKIHSKEELLY